MDQQADRPPPHGIHGICPVPLVTETADTRIVIGLEGHGTIRLPHRLSHLHVESMRSVLLASTPHTVKYAARKRRVPASAGSRCQRSVIARRPAAISCPLCHGHSLRAGVEARTPER